MSHKLFFTQQTCFCLIILLLFVKTIQSKENLLIHYSISKTNSKTIRNVYENVS